MSNKTPQQIFEELTKGLPTFDDGRIDFTHAKKAPVLTVILHFDGRILLLKRSERVLAYPGKWNGISGFIDEPKPIEDFAQQEISEELSLRPELVKRVTVCPPYQVDDRAIGRIWYVYPVLAECAARPDIKLDWEHTDHAWILPEDLGDYDCLKDLDLSVTRALEALR